MGYNLCKFCENGTSDTPMRGVYIPHFVKSQQKFKFWGSYTLIVAPMGGKFGTEKGTSSVLNFTSMGATCRP